MATTKQLVGITSQHNEIVKRVGNGSLDPTVVKQALQDIIEGKLPQVQNWSLPIWWRTAEQQLERARQLWPNAVLPEPPKAFTPRTKSEVLLLHVPDSFDSLWDKIVVPEGHAAKYRREDVKSPYLTPVKHELKEPTWLAFDPEHGKGESPDSFWGQSEVRLAASEILSALIQFPKWSLAWYVNDTSAPCLSGYQLRYEQGGLKVPYLDQRSQLQLLDVSASEGLDPWSSPSVREC